MKLPQVKKLISSFAYRFFEFHGRGHAIGFETNVHILHEYAYYEQVTIAYDSLSSACIWISFLDLYFYFTVASYILVFDEKVSSLDISSSEHCARRKKRLQAEEARHIAIQESNY